MYSMAFLVSVFSLSTLITAMVDEIQSNRQEADEKRRNNLRQKAYTRVNNARAVKQHREELWQFLASGGCNHD